MEYRKIDDGFIVRCDIGDEVISTLTGFAADNDIRSGTLMGIGAMKDVVLGYFDLVRKEYIQKKFDGIYELLSLTGNFAMKDSATILHCHAVISDVDFQVFGGHLFIGVIAVTGEFYISPGGVEIHRSPDDYTGLNLVKF